MTETKFTKGPWEILQLVDCAEIRSQHAIIADLHSGNFYSSSGNGKITYKECCANAQLIAAAPMLYEAL